MICPFFSSVGKASGFLRLFAKTINGRHNRESNTWPLALLSCFFCTRKAKNLTSVPLTRYHFSGSHIFDINMIRWWFLDTCKLENSSTALSTLAYILKKEAILLRPIAVKSQWRGLPPVQILFGTSKFSKTTASLHHRLGYNNSTFIKRLYNKRLIFKQIL